MLKILASLKGFSEAIAQVFPQTEIKLYVIHQIRHSFRYVTSRDQKSFMQDLKLIYQAISKDLVEQQLDQFDSKPLNKRPD